jgi:hypothetical protein
MNRSFGSLVALLATALLTLLGHSMQVCAQPAQAQLELTDYGLRGEWKRTGPAFACQVATREKLSREDAVKKLALACLYMGPLAIGSEAALVQRLLGTPFRTVPQPNNVTAYAYLLDSPSRRTYMVATIWRDRVAALQITGPEPAKGFSFNHVELGASSETLIEHFGRPMQVDPSAMKDTEQWSYRPWSFSFEVSGGRVTSIRIAYPGM